MSREMTPHVPRSFEHGCALRPVEALRAWLDAHTGHVLRMPCFLPKRDNSHAVIGELACRLDDSRMGVGIESRALSGASMWLEGYWRGTDVFVVIWFGGFIDDLDGTAVEIELLS